MPLVLLDPLHSSRTSALFPAVAEGVAVKWEHCTRFLPL